ncbi:MAG TPA: DUF1553 domain-containing protein, partial [Acidobacteriota bacterium]|nr:DUF1553 domain-containing protein [Acidobacteriota bacterium]
MRSRSLWCVLGICLAPWLLAFVSGDSKNASVKPVDFDRDIRPILSDNCYACHGPDEKKRRASLRLDTREGAFAKSNVIVAKDPERSRLIQRISSADPDFHMPPPESDRVLTENQIALMRRWVQEGAKWETHWAYVPPKCPDLPKVKLELWPRNEIDYFILNRLEREGLKPSPEADRATLLRRVTLDLTGLPPTPADVDSFLADRSAGAYEKRVDALLHSPHYGERMAMQWLDLARYADTHGYHIDSHREMWRWRDWVTDAFNRNLPYDQFTVEQLAGDLLPGATVEQKIASGFNRNHMINFEGGAIPEEYQVEYVVDRVETTSVAWMGMTLGCARCHNHKFDPITQKEFYQFYAFFNNVSEEGLDGKTGNAHPYLQLPSDAQKARLDELGAAIKERQSLLTETRIKPIQDEWEKGFLGRVAAAPHDGLAAHYEMDGSFSDVSGHYRHGRTVQGDPTFGPGRIGKAANFDGDTRVKFDNFALGGSGPFTLAFWLNGSGHMPIAVLQQIDNASTRRGFEILLEDLNLVGIQRWAARLTVRLTSRWPDNGIELRTKDHLEFGDWYHITVRYDGSVKATGLQVYIDGKRAETETVRDSLSEPISTMGELEIGNKETGSAFTGQVDDLRVYSRALAGGEIDQLAIHYPIHALLSGVTGRRSEREVARCRDYFLTYVAPKDLRRAHSELKRLLLEKKELEKTIPSVMVMDELEKPRQTFVLARGDYRNRTDPVKPGVPAVLPPLPKDAPLNRLSLARWLVDPGNPLTARVAVNHFWQMYFGTGIVKTSEDFGSQGEPPVNQELLDWLATEFLRTKWDVRAMQRLIVTSSTYRQASRITSELLERDPENRFLARGPRFRLPAEIVRDNALAISGLLNPEIGGPGVFPYQPKGLWEEMAFGDGFSAQSYTPSHGKDLYRRTLYTFWKRSVPPPSLLTFDAPDREKCMARRAPTNTPLQALVLLNDPTYVEAARGLAQRVLREGGQDDQSRIRYA